MKSVSTTTLPDVRGARHGALSVLPRALAVAAVSIAFAGYSQDALASRTAGTKSYAHYTADGNFGGFYSATRKWYNCDKGGLCTVELDGVVQDERADGHSVVVVAGFKKFDSGCECMRDFAEVIQEAAPKGKREAFSGRYFYVKDLYTRVCIRTGTGVTDVGGGAAITVKVAGCSLWQ